MSRVCHRKRREMTTWLGLCEAERESVRAHAAGCEACRRELDRTLEVVSRLDASRESYRALRYTGPRPEGLDEQRARWADRGRDGLRGWRWRPISVALASVLFSLSAALYVLSSGKTPTPPQAPPARESTVSESTVATPLQPVISPSKIRPVSASKSLEAIRRRTLQLERPTAPKKPSGFSLRLPSRPASPPQQREGQG